MGISPVLWQFLVKWLNASALFPREASTIAPYMDSLYFFLISITLVGVFLVATLLEATWTIIPLGLFLICFVWGALLYFRNRRVGGD